MNIAIKDPSSLPRREAYIQRGRMMGLSRNKNWIARLIDKGFIKAANKDNAILPRHREMFKTVLLQMMDIMDRKWEDKWDIHLKMSESMAGVTYSLYFLIHYEQFTITNFVENHSRVLRDLIVALPVHWSSGNSLPYIGTPRGVRATLDQEELTSSYRHSHLCTTGIPTGVGVFNTQKFCIGVGTEVEYLVSELATVFEPEQFEYLLYCLDTMVQCESQEGGAYIYMSQIASQKEGRGPTNHNVSTYYGNFSFKSSFIDVDFYISNDRYKIRTNDRLESFIRSRILDQNPELAYEILVKGREGNFVSYSQQMANEGLVAPIDSTRFKDRKGQPYYTVIAGRKIPFKVHTPNGEKPIPPINEFHVYPKFIKYVSEQLERDLYEASVRGSAIRTYHTRNNASRVPGQG